MKFIVAFSCLFAVASAVPAIIAPAAVTYQSQKQYLAPVGTNVYTTVSKAAPIVSVSAPVLAPLAAPLPLAAGHLSAPYAPLAAAPLIGAPLGISKTILSGPAVLGGPILHK